MEQFSRILIFIVNSFIHIWPYLLITIPIAVVINLSGASKHIQRIFNNKPLLSILLATAVGAVSPFCSCGVIPVIASLLIGGVPLGPVMSFWIASPSMDPEVFFLSVASVGWKLSVWRLAATFVISFTAGILTHMAQKRGYFGEDILRNKSYSLTMKPRVPLVQLIGIRNPSHNAEFTNCCVTVDSTAVSSKTENCGCSSSQPDVEKSWRTRILYESWKSLRMVTTFMFLAFFINALIKFYLPADMVSGIIGGNNPFSVIIATLVGIPFYTTNATALPLVSGLLSLGMNPGAALAFLIAGPLTTLPAMMAVWGIVKPRVFFVFLAFGLTGSIVFGYLYNILQGMW